MFSLFHIKYLIICGRLGNYNTMSQYFNRGGSRISEKGFICIKVCVCAVAEGRFVDFLKYPMKMK